MPENAIPEALIGSGINFHLEGVEYGPGVANHFIDPNESPLPQISAPKLCVLCGLCVNRSRLRLVPDICAPGSGRQKSN